MVPGDLADDERVRPAGMTTAREDGRAPRVETSRTRSRLVEGVQVLAVPAVPLAVLQRRRRCVPLPADAAHVF